MPTPIPFPTPDFLTAGGRWFDETGVQPSPAATVTTLLRVAVPQGSLAIVMGVGVDGGQLTNWYWGNFWCEINGAPDPTFNNVRGMICRLLDLMPLYRVAKPASTIEVKVQNLNVSVSFQYAARVVGYFMSSTSEYGQRIVQARLG